MREGPMGPLDGSPIGHKDICNTAGDPNDRPFTAVG
jgi:Asp-tRNA(Asn)/Glu-tRNA(Gln) amidotransferase A subunit family amidase